MEHFVPNLSWILGIDQTGALCGKGVRPLPYCLLTQDHGVWKIESRPPRFLKGLPHLNRNSLEFLLPNFETRQGLVGIDCVLGLPRVCGITQKQLKRCFQVAFHSYKNGLKEGQRHFASYLSALNGKRRSIDSDPLRDCEKRAKAQSVFKTFPAQRNVQTGTHRIWRDLGEDVSWFELWPSTRPTKTALLCEVYPSLFWRNLFGEKSRRPKQIKSISKSLQLRGRLENIYHSDADWADAAIAALGILKTVKSESSKGLTHLPRSAKTEGWILGLN